MRLDRLYSLQNAIRSVSQHDFYVSFPGWEVEVTASQSPYLSHTEIKFEKKDNKEETELWLNFDRFVLYFEEKEGREMIPAKMFKPLFKRPIFQGVIEPLLLKEGFPDITNISYFWICQNDWQTWGEIENGKEMHMEERIAPLKVFFKEDQLFTVEEALNLGLCKEGIEEFLEMNFPGESGGLHLSQLIQYKAGISFLEEMKEMKEKEEKE